MSRNIRLYILQFFLTVIFLFLMYRLWQLQIVNGSKYAEDYELKITRTVREGNTRGIIYDCNGEVLAYNELVFTVTMIDNGDYSSNRERQLSLNSMLYRVITRLAVHHEQVNNELKIVQGASGGIREPEAASYEEPEIVEADWSAYFDGLNGAAVIYDAAANRYTIYNQELAQTRRPPCSTFKIVSSLIALENGIIEPEASVHTWSGEIFWNENWNQDMDFRDAFRTSCVWYFREVIDETGKETVQEALDALGYGNCDISDWEGRLNTNNSNRALTGFWIESSLKISPKEQAEVMERIFGTDAAYAEETRHELKEVMSVTEGSGDGLCIYGKTGMGKAEGIVVDAWFTGFAERGEGNLYYCVYLGRTDGMNVSSAGAREIALRLLADY